jgi:hypothetical protein
LALPFHVITGLVPVIVIRKSAAVHRIGMAGTRPAMTWWNLFAFRPTKHPASDEAR